MSKPKRRAKAKTKRLLEGSCQCGKITFSVESETPVPFMFCFCSICRKTGGGAFGCNIMGLRKTLALEGRRSLRFYHARIREKGKPTRMSQGKRWFCGACGSHLYLTDERWPEGIWPYVAAIDSELPAPARPVLMMTRFKPTWVPSWLTRRGKTYPRYPEVSIAAWHEREGWPVSVEP
ncbi:MAG TPA: GFA family protein [Polyangiaceae bacterium]|jgi:hypothetical protein|nr:GFA family protein [Polyangiaceae bacterium]